jgi:hypothetical protein
MTIPSRHIIQELQKEIANGAHQNKLLESENKLLLSETEQLSKVILRKINHPRRFLKQLIEYERFGRQRAE